MPPDLLTVAEAAKLKGCATRTLYHSVAVGRLKAHRYGRTVLIARAALEAWELQPMTHPRKETTP